MDDLIADIEVIESDVADCEKSSNSFDVAF
jgi:hypothetical protein